MASKAGARIKITLRCSECKQRNYNTMKNKKNTPDRLELNKYCPADQADCVLLSYSRIDVVHLTASFCLCARYFLMALRWL